jgi:hypothetical protein
MHQAGVALPHCVRSHEATRRSASAGKHWFHADKECAFPQIKKGVAALKKQKRMKVGLMKRYVILLYLLSMVSGVQTATEYRDFTSTDGRVIRGAVKAYDLQKEMVTIERDDKRKVKVPISVFCGEDQDHIMEWESSQFFYDDSALKIRCDKRRIGQRKEKEWQDVRYVGGEVRKILVNETAYESVLYDIAFYSRNEADLTDLRLDYIIYYEQSTISWEKPEVVQKTKRAQISIPVIKGRTPTKVETESVEVHSDNVTQGAWVSDRVRTGGEGDVHGLRARLYMKLPSGRELVREFSYPDKLSEERFPW